MSATIVLDSRHNHFTNLDTLSGRVVLTLPNEAPISGIQVKLEGESRTRLSGPRNPQNVHSDKKRTELEVHKILYKVATVFPTAAVMQGGTPPASYTFAAGSYEYPFQFKFPFNNACSPNSMLNNITFAGIKMEVARDSNRHVKKTLPPSLSGFPGEAEIRYFVKATIIRPQFYKENIRSVVPLNFLPIEPPRTGNPNEETFARRHYQFSKNNAKMQKGKNKKGLFSRASTTALQEDEIAPRVSVDARLPNPSILTCNEPIPLRLIAKKVTESPETIYLQMLQIELIAYTKVIAHDLTRRESNMWVIMSRSNIDLALGTPGDKHGTDWIIDPSMWNTLPLPNSVAPSFETCNIERSYELDIRVGLSYGASGKSQPMVISLRMPVKVFSGIAPPQALLDAMAAARVQPPTPLVQRPSWPTEQTPELESRPAMPPRPTRPPVPAESTAEYDDAPPSYEDAMADNLSPVDGPRREYHPPDASPLQTTIEPGTDGKSSAEASRTREGGPAPEGRVTPSQDPYNRRSSSESFDMLPGTPPESSPPGSPVSRHLSILKAQRATVHEDSPPQYEPIAEPQQVPNTMHHQPSRNNLRPMNLGVPSRKPVPGSSRSPPN